MALADGAVIAGIRDTVLRPATSTPTSRSP